MLKKQDGDLLQLEILMIVLGAVLLVLCILVIVIFPPGDTAYLCSPGTQPLWTGGFCGSEWLSCLRDRPLFYGRGCFGVSRRHQLGKG